MSNTSTLIYSLPATAALGTTLSLVVCFSFVTNFGAVFIFVTDPTLRTFSDRLYLNLAVADSFVVASSMTVRVGLSLTGRMWLWTRRNCLAFVVLETVVNYVSVVNTLMLSLDHYLQVSLRSWYRQTARLLLVMVATPWFAIFLSFGVPILAWHDKMDTSEGVCGPPFQSRPVTALVFLLSPFIFITAVPVVDVLIYFTIRKRYLTKIKHALRLSSKLSPEILEISLEAGEVSVVRDVLEAEGETKSRSRTTAEAGRPDFETCGGLKSPSPRDADEGNERPGRLTLTPSRSSEADPRSVNLRKDSRSGKDAPDTDEVVMVVYVSEVEEENAYAKKVEEETVFTSEEDEDTESPGELGKEKARAGEERAENATARDRVSTPGGPSDSGVLVEQTLEALKEYSRDLKEARLSLVLGMVLVICCTPFELMKLVDALCGMFTDRACLVRIAEAILDAAHWLVLLNSSVNPVVFFVVDQRYTAAFWNFCKRFGCRR